MSNPWPEICGLIAENVGEHFTLQSKAPIGGGCIDAAWWIADETTRYFVKVSDTAATESLYRAEGEGLETLRNNGVRTPRTIACGSTSETAFLILEYVDLKPPAPNCHAALGRQLAELHRTTRHCHGWHRNNRIGATPQSNREHESWADFYCEERLKPQFERLFNRGAPPQLEHHATQLFRKIPALLDNYTPAPSLLHGDLWSGNFSADEQGEPVLYDPAVYFGDRETDLAMSELFGGFSSDFYAAYNQAWRLDPGYQRRKPLYQLYHVLNHANLFGGGYVNQTISLIRKILR